MPSRSKKFTDHNLKLFYANVLLHYKKLTEETNDPHILWQRMFTAVQYALESPSGSLYGLDPKEKAKVYSAFETIFNALPVFQTQKNKFKPDRPVFNPQISFVIYDYNRYNCYDPIMDWLLIRAILADCSFHRHCSSHTGSIGGWGGHSRTHGHSRENNDNSDVAAAFAALAIIPIAAAIAVAAAIALYYMLNEFIDGVERFYYGEGWLNAALMMATSVVSGLGSTLLSFQFLSPVLIPLAVTAGFNPAAVVIGITFCVAAVGAGLGALAMSLVYGSMTKNEDSMDPNDSLRFSLTETDEKHLEQLNIDPIKVKCAMIALRQKIADTLDQDKKDKSGNNTAVPYFLHRMFGNNNEVQKLLQQVRDLKRGKISMLDVGDMHFDCKKSVVYTAAQTETAPGYDAAPAVSADLPQYEPYTPSAPPPSYEASI